MTTPDLVSAEELVKRLLEFEDTLVDDMGGQTAAWELADGLIDEAADLIVQLLKERDEANKALYLLRLEHDNLRDAYDALSRIGDDLP